MTNKRDLGLAAVFFLVSVVSSAFLVYLVNRPADVKPAAWEPLQTSPIAAGKPKTTIEHARVRAYKPEIKATLNLPPATIESPDQQVTAVAILDAEERPYTLTAIHDQATGDSVIHARPEPLPWLSMRQSGRVALTYGIRGGDPMGRLTWDHHVARVKDFSLISNITLDQDGQYYLGAGIGWRY